jgi:hypothetical protein
LFIGFCKSDTGDNAPHHPWDIEYTHKNIPISIKAVNPHNTHTVFFQSQFILEILFIAVYFTNKEAYANGEYLV